MFSKSQYSKFVYELKQTHCMSDLLTIKGRTMNNKTFFEIVMVRLILVRKAFDSSMCLDFWTIIVQCKMSILRFYHLVLLFNIVTCKIKFNLHLH